MLLSSLEGFIPESSIRCPGPAMEHMRSRSTNSQAFSGFSLEFSIHFSTPWSILGANIECKGPSKIGPEYTEPPSSPVDSSVQAAESWTIGHHDVQDVRNTSSLIP